MPAIATPPDDPRFAPALYCPRCDYDLRGLTSDRCPECGQILDAQSLRMAAVPWERRRQVGPLGRVRMFWWTVARVSFRTHRFASAAALPVGLRDAVWFRRVLCGWLMLGVVLPAIAVLIAINVIDFDALSDVVEWVGPWRSLGLLLAVLAGAWLFLLGITGVHSYWFHPRHLDLERQNRAVAVSLYAAAPLAWTPLMWVPLAVAAALRRYTDPWRGTSGTAIDVLSTVTALTPFAAAMVTWLVTLRLARLAARRGFVGQASLLLALPPLWLTLLMLTVVGTPAVAFYLWLLLPLI